QRRMRAALAVPFVHRLQTTPPGRLLSATQGLQRLDLAAQRFDVGGRALDACIEAGDVALLVGQTPFDRLDFRDHPRLACARLRSLFPLLAQLPLCLLQLLLLRRDPILGLLRRGLGCRGGGDHRSHQADGERDAPAHGSARPRANQPPQPPSIVPANISTTTVCVFKNVSRSSPSVWLTSGSSRGPATV